jgi:hypothetical protein
MRHLFAFIYNFKKIVYYLLASNLITISLAGIVLAGTFNLYGPETFQRDIAKPNLENRHFEVSNPDAVYILKVVNGQGLEDTAFEKVSSSVLMINGIHVLTPKEFNQKVSYFEKQIELNSSNNLTVEVLGKPGGAITIEIIGIDDEPPTIIANKNPTPNANGWNNTDVTISFTCDDSISGIATCPDPVVIESEGKDQTVLVTATDKAGNSKTISVMVNIDKTPPNITRSWPPDNNFGTDRDSIDIEGEITDSLSGVNNAELHHDSNIIQLDIPFLSISRSLDTLIPSGYLWKTNGFKLKATDRADNSSEETFSVLYTLGATVSPTNPARTEIINSLPTSFERAIIRFNPSISRDQIHLIISQEEGRVVGYLPTLNIAIAQFETQDVVALKAVLSNLVGKNEVEVATPAIFQPSIEFDNDSLGNNGSAYSNIQSSSASQFIIDNLLFPPLLPVDIAVIETGLDVTYGQNNEFDDIYFYNLCTPEGLQGQTGTPVDTLTRPSYAHGTKITGILAGANNGSGNNGIIRGIENHFRVHVFRMNCGGYNDYALTLAALDLIVGGSLSTTGVIDVVNMSFGWIPSDLEARENTRSIFEGYFDSPVGREILWVGGAGNDDKQIECNEFFPSGLACDLHNVISVGAYNSDDLLRGRWISSTGQQFGSNFGEGVTLSAPGTNVWTAIEPGTYGGVSGTSASAPLVTGASALMISAYQLSPQIVKQLLINNTQELNASELPEGGLNVLDFIRAGSIPCPCFTAGDLNTVEWDIWCDYATSFEYLLDNSASGDPGPIVGASATTCFTGSFYDSVEQEITEAEAEMCLALIIDTAINQETRKACRID